MIKYIDKKLFFDSVNVTDIAAEIDTPFYLYSETTLLSQYKHFQEAVLEHIGVEHQICFALKANPNPFLLESLFKVGAGADIVSGGELQRALNAGCPAQRIVFSGVGKTKQEIQFALNQGIYSFNVESQAELELINLIALEQGKIARVAFRLNPEVNAKTHKYISTGYKTHKFGILKQDIIDFMKTSLPGVQVVGLSIHIGSQLTDFKATKKAVREICELAKMFPESLEFLDLGGGLGVDYEKRELQSYLADYMSKVSEVLKEQFPEKLPRILFEPGRFIAAHAGLFITKVIRTKQSGKINFAIVDGGMNDFVRTSLYGAYHKIVPLEINDKSKIKMEIVGPICETSDSFASKYKIQELEPEDLIAVCDVGAYGHSMSSTYNLRRRPVEVTLTTHGEMVIHEY